MKIVKRKANLVPYRFVNNCLELYLSHRSINAKQYPNCWSFWGGAIEEGESPEEALVREIQEELNWRPDKFDFLGMYYDSKPNEKFIFFTKVDGEFENEISICEGQSGKFFTKEEIENEDLIINEDKIALFDIFISLQKS